MISQIGLPWKRYQYCRGNPIYPMTVYSIGWEKELASLVHAQHVDLSARPLPTVTNVS